MKKYGGQEQAYLKRKRNMEFKNEISSENLRTLLNDAYKENNMSKDMFDKTLMDFAMLFHKEQKKTNIDANTLLSNTLSIREFAEIRIYRCKESAYGKNTNADNDSEGDYGKWDDWQEVLEDFAVFVLKMHT